MHLKNISRDKTEWFFKYYMKLLADIKMKFYVFHCEVFMKLLDNKKWHFIYFTMTYKGHPKSPEKDQIRITHLIGVQQH